MGAGRQKSVTAAVPNEGASEQATDWEGGVRGRERACAAPLTAGLRLTEGVREERRSRGGVVVVMVVTAGAFACLLLLLLPLPFLLPHHHPTLTTAADLVTSAATDRPTNQPADGNDTLHRCLSSTPFFCPPFMSVTYRSKSLPHSTPWAPVFTLHRCRLYRLSLSLCRGSPSVPQMDELVDMLTTTLYTGIITCDVALSYLLTKRRLMAL